MEIDSETSDPDSRHHLNDADNNHADNNHADKPPASLSPGELKRLSPAALAYLGDAIYELHVRKAFLLPPKRIESYHRQVVSQVRAETQALHLQALMPHLTPTELEWVRRGRNAASTRSRRVDPEIYQQASGLETLVGYLYLTDPQRLSELLNSLTLTSPAFSS